MKSVISVAKRLGPSAGKGWSLQRERNTSLTVTSIFLDVLTTFAAFLLAYKLRLYFSGIPNALHPLAHYSWFFIVSLGIILLTNYFLGFYTFGRTQTRGEIVIVVAPPADENASADDVDGLLRQALARVSVKDAVGEVALATGRPRREIYQRALALTKDAQGHGNAAR